MNLLCWVGLHFWHDRQKWTPNFEAEVVTRVEMRAVCLRCGKVKQLADDRFEPDWKEKKGPTMTRYFLKASWDTDYTEVTKKKWIEVERSCGFYPKGMTTRDPRYMDTCATAGFTSGEIKGRIEFHEGEADE